MLGSAAGAGAQAVGADAAGAGAAAAAIASFERAAHGGPVPCEPTPTVQCRGRRPLSGTCSWWGVPRPVARRRHLPHCRAVQRAVRPQGVCLEEHLHRPCIQATPAPAFFAAVVPRRACPASAAPATRCSSRPDMQDHDVVLLMELDVLTDRVLDPQQGARGWRFARVLRSSVPHSRQARN